MPPRAKPKGKAPPAKGGALGKKYGKGPLPKLPVWGWVVVGGVAYLIYKKTRAAPPAGATDGTVNPGDFQPVDYSGTGVPYSPPYGLGNAGLGFQGSGAPAPVAVPAAGLDAHQLHVLHMQHLANTRTTAKRPGGGTGAHARPDAHQLHELHLAHMRHLKRRRR